MHHDITQMQYPILCCYNPCLEFLSRFQNLLKSWLPLFIRLSRKWTVVNFLFFCPLFASRPPSAPFIPGQKGERESSISKSLSLFSPGAAIVPRLMRQWQHCRGVTESTLGTYRHTHAHTTHVCSWDTCVWNDLSKQGKVWRKWTVCFTTAFFVHHQMYGSPDHGTCGLDRVYQSAQQGVKFMTTLSTCLERFQRQKGLWMTVARL